MMDIDGITLRNVTLQSKDSLISVNDGNDILFEQVHFFVPSGKIKIDSKGKLTRLSQMTRCLMTNY